MNDTASSSVITNQIASNTPAAATPETPSNPSPSPSSNPSTPAPTAPSPATPSTPAPTPVSNYDYKNGTYRTQTSYRTPDGTYQMDVTVAIANDSITSANVTFDAQGARDGYSKRFSSGFQNQVVGKDLGTVSLSRVGGASLTTRAFNTALGTIRANAAS